MAVSGSFAYVVDDTAGLRVIDVSNPISPTEIGFYDTPGWAYGVAVSGNLAYVADDDGGLLILRYQPYTLSVNKVYLPVVLKK